MYRKYLATIGASFFGLFVFAFSQSAHAFSFLYYNYDGNLCVSVDNSPWITHSIWGVGNTHPSEPMTVVCPVTVSRPITGGLPRPKIDGITVGMYNRNSSQNLSCTISAKRLNGEIRTYEEKIVSRPELSGPGTGSQGPHTLLGLREVPANMAIADQTLMMQCTIPPAQQGWHSHLVSYQLTVEVD